jgi:hypothetical protein
VVDVAVVVNITDNPAVGRLEANDGIGIRYLRPRGGHERHGHNDGAGIPGAGPHFSADEVPGDSGGMVRNDFATAHLLARNRGLTYTCVISKKN